MQESLTHIASDGTVQMVDVGAKARTKRKALAEAIISLSPKTMALLEQNALPKGDALGCARIGGIMAAKETSRLIPLCHNIVLSFVDVRFEVRKDPPSIRVIAEAHANGETGVEMEAIVAAEIAATIIYDMCKAVQRDMVISDVRLLHKSGGRSGEYNAGDSPC